MIEYLNNLGIKYNIKEEMLIIDLDDLSLKKIIGKQIKVKSINYRYRDDELIETKVSNPEIYYLKHNNEFGIKFNNLSKDDKCLEDLIINLIRKQGIIKLSQLPIGIIRYNGKVVGQIIKMYNGMSLKELCILKELKDIRKYYNYNLEDIDLLFKIYMDIINIIEELYNNDILYKDIHAGNFIVDNNKINLIDFDSKYIVLGNNLWIDYAFAFYNLFRMINRVNYNFGISKELIYDNRDVSFDGAKEQILSLRKKI